MPWSPTVRHPPDPRLDAYRNRLASLYRSGVLVGYLLVLTEYGAVQLGGHLWWRRWTSESEFVQPQVQLLDGTWWDFVVLDEDLDRELDDWARGRFDLTGTETLDLVWSSEQESVERVPAIFGLEHCVDNDGHVSWSFPTPAS